MFLDGQPSAFFNNTALPGDITKISITINKSAGADGEYYIDVFESAHADFLETSTFKYVHQDGSLTLTNSTENRKFFNITTRVKKGQIKKVEITYKTK